MIPTYADSLIHILIVEDNPGDADLVKEFLHESQGDVSFSVHHSDSLCTAIRDLQSTSVDAILLDLGLPDSTGLQTFDAMFEETTEIPILVLTGADDMELALEAVQRGATDFLTKGRIDSEVLARAIRYGIERTRARKELKESEERYRRFFEGSLVSVYVATPEGRIVDCNEAFARLISSPTRQHVFDLPLRELYAVPGDYEQFVSELHAERVVGNSERVLQRFDGTLVWVIENARLLPGDDGLPALIEGTLIDLSKRKRAEGRQELFSGVLEILNRPDEWEVLLQDILKKIQGSTGVDAVGIRLENNGDYPYVAVSGFPKAFLATESSICARDKQGNPMRDRQGRIILECMCGSVLQGRTDASLPWYTKRGSFWTNSTSDLLLETRKSCNAFSFESVAIVAVQSGGANIGLLQLNDRERNAFDLESIEFFEDLAASIGVAYNRQASEERIKRLLERQTHVNQLTLELGESLDIHEIHTTIYRHIRSLMDAEGFMISQYDAQEDVHAANFAVIRGQEQGASEQSMLLHELGTDALRRVARTGQPLYIPDSQLVGSPSNLSDIAPELGTIAKTGESLSGAPETQAFRSALLVPMQLEGTVLGILQVLSNQVGAYTREDISLLAGLANVAAIALQTANLYSEVEQDARLLRERLIGTIRALADTTEARDPYTAGHQRRVAELSTAIARRLCLPDDAVQSVFMAGLVHDIGKVSTPAEILSKPGRLSEIEYNLIKAHAQTGFDILRKIDLPGPIAATALQHHERIDGSGYPEGCVGDSICLEARIIAVADVIEAMANHRPYRPALGTDKALDEIEEKRGILYDPDVVDAALALFRDESFVFTE